MVRLVKEYDNSHIIISEDAYNNKSSINRSTQNIVTMLEQYIKSLDHIIEIINQANNEIQTGNFGSASISDKNDDEYFEPNVYTSDNYIDDIENYAKLNAIKYSISDYAISTFDAIQNLRDSEEFVKWYD